MLELVYKGVPMQVVNVHMSAKGTAKEYRPLLHWLHAHVAPNSRLVLMGGADLFAVCLILIPDIVFLKMAVGSLDSRGPSGLVHHSCSSA